MTGTNLVGCLPEKLVYQEDHLANKRGIFCWAKLIEIYTSELNKHYHIIQHNYKSFLSITHKSWADSHGGRGSITAKRAFISSMCLQSMHTVGHLHRACLCKCKVCDHCVGVTAFNPLCKCCRMAAVRCDDKLIKQTFVWVVHKHSFLATLSHAPLDPLTCLLS